MKSYSKTIAIACSILEDITRDAVIDNSIVDEDENTDKRQKIDDQIIALKASLASIVAKKKMSNYNQKYDNLTKANHNKRLMEIPKKIKELQTTSADVK